MLYDTNYNQNLCELVHFVCITPPPLHLKPLFMLLGETIKPFLSNQKLLEMIIGFFL